MLWPALEMPGNLILCADGCGLQSSGFLKALRQHWDRFLQWAFQFFLLRDRYYLYRWCSQTLPGGSQVLRSKVLAQHQWDNFGLLLNQAQKRFLHIQEPAIQAPRLFLPSIRHPLERGDLRCWCMRLLQRQLHCHHLSQLFCRQVQWWTLFFVQECI